MIINGVNFTIVGVYANSGGFEGGKAIFTPYSTFLKMYNEGNKVKWIAVNIKDEYDIKKAEEKIKTVLKQRHQVNPEDTQAIGGFNLGEKFKELFGFMRGLELLTAIVGFLTLFAGAIAVSSILLITVKERTKEFGIRRALGAQPRQILNQILIESAVITFISGMIGVILGTAILAVINNIVDKSEDSEIPLVNCSVDITILLGAFAIIVLLAILAGLIPAFRAIQIKPIDALREE